ncbi:hypothetical protein JCM8097_006157 [Rhodosporidiobolus ruineniae]
MPLRAWTPSPPPGARRSTSRMRSRSPSRRNDRHQAGLDEQQDGSSGSKREREWDRDKHFEGQGEGERTPPRRDRRAGTEGRYFSPGQRRKSTGGRGEKSEARREDEPRWAERPNDPGPPLPAPPTKVSFADANLPTGAYFSQRPAPPERRLYLLRLVLHKPHLGPALIGHGGEIQRCILSQANLLLFAVEGGRNRYVDLVGSAHTIGIGVRLANEVLSQYKVFRPLRFEGRDLQIWPNAWLEDRYVDGSTVLPPPAAPLPPGTFVRDSSPLPPPETQLCRYYLTFPWRGVADELATHGQHGFDSIRRRSGLKHLDLVRTERGYALGALMFGTEAAIRRALEEVERAVYGVLWEEWEEKVRGILRRRGWVEWVEGQCVPQRGLWVKEDREDDGGERAMDVDEEESLTPAAPQASTSSALSPPSRRLDPAVTSNIPGTGDAAPAGLPIHPVEQTKPLQSPTPVYLDGGVGRSPPLSPAVSSLGGASPAQSYYHDDSGFGHGGYSPASPFAGGFSPTSPAFSPAASPTHSAGSLRLSPVSPRMSPPVSPRYSPAPTVGSPASPAFSPFSPVYSNPSPRLPSPYSFASGAFTPRFPAFTPSFPPPTLAPKPGSALQPAVLAKLRAEVEASRDEKRKSGPSPQAEAERLRKRLEEMKKARQAERGRGARGGGLVEAGEREGRSSRRRDGREERDGRERGREGRDEERRSGARRERRSRSRSRSPRRDRERERERDRGEDGRKKRSGRKAEEEPEEELVQEIEYVHFPPLSLT